MIKYLSIFILFHFSLAGIYSQSIATISGNSVVFDNGVLEAEVFGGRMNSLKKNGSSNLLTNGGYGYFSHNDTDGFHSPSSSRPEVKINNEDIADIYFIQRGDFEVEMHYVFKKEDSGFYTYFIIRDNDQAFKVLSEVRFALRVDKNIFDYAWTVEREGPMIPPADLANAVEEIQDATYRLTDGSIYTKYDWSVYRRLDTLHGLMGNGYGIWNIEPSHEYVNGGPNMQELTVHGTTTTPILFTAFQSKHYGNSGVALKAEYEKWSKIYGPSYNYINSGTNEEVLADAQQQTSIQIAQWPYEWLDHELYPLDRGSLTGTLAMQGKGIVDSALIILSKPKPSFFPADKDWQNQPYDYIFYGEADENGKFRIENIREGTYNLYAYTQKGKLVDRLFLEDVEINLGANDLGEIDWDNNDQEHVIFQIGEADLTAQGFALTERPRYYGAWNDTPDELDFTVGSSLEKDDWYYCQRVNTDWRILFDIESVDRITDPVLKVAFAGADAGPNFRAVINGNEIGSLRLGSDSSIRRSSLTGGKHSVVTFDFDQSLLIEGTNTLSLEAYGSSLEYKALLYDAVLLESNIDNSVSTYNRVDDSSLNIYGYDRKIFIESDFKENAKVQVYNIADGRLVYSGDVSSSIEEIPMGRSGQFVIQVVNNNQNHIRKVLLF